MKEENENRRMSMVDWVNYGLWGGAIWYESVCDGKEK